MKVLNTSEVNQVSGGDSASLAILACGLSCFNLYLTLEMASQFIDTFSMMTEALDVTTKVIVKHEHQLQNLPGYQGNMTIAV